MNKDLFKDLIWQCHGIITLVCCELNCSYVQFYRALKKFGLEEELKKAKEAFLSVAEATLFESLGSKSEGNRLKAASEVLKYCAPHPQQEITVKTGDDGQKEIQIRQIFGIDQ